MVGYVLSRNPQDGRKANLRRNGGSHPWDDARVTSFHDHLGLLGAFVDRRDDIVSRLEAQLLNVQGKDAARRRDRPFFEQTFEGCFYGAPGIPGKRSASNDSLR